MAATVIALGRMRRLTTGALMRGFTAARPARSRRPATAARGRPGCWSPRAGRCPAGSRTGSGRRCRRSATLSPALTLQTMRRAIRPAICTAITSAPSGVRITTLLRSLSALAAARSAEPNSPGRCSTVTTSPPIGARCTCASSTDRKMLIRGNGVAGRPSSAGGSSSSMRQTSPSAGATTRPGRVGGTRGGCRKNAALAAADASPARRSQRCCGGPPRRPPGSRRRTAGRPGASGERGADQRHESRGACLEVGASGHRAAILRAGGRAHMLDRSHTCTVDPAATSLTSSWISSRQFADASQRRWCDAGGP